MGAILVADTTVILDDRPLGKPADEAEARAMLRALSGRAHHVSTCFAIAGPDDPGLARHAETVTSRVVFRALDDQFHPAIGQIPHPAGQFKTAGHRLHGIAEAHALNPAFITNL